MSKNNKNVFFLCYSRYAIFVAYILKETVYKNDRVSLIIPDSTANYDGLVEQMERSKCWDEVIPFQELEDIENVGKKVKDFIEKNNIDVFCVAHIMRRASHFFTEYLSDNTEINMFDEGTISIDFQDEYTYYWKNVMTRGWVEFHFERVSNIYSLFPTITKPFYNATVKGIDLEIVKDEEFVQRLNNMYEYNYEKQDIETIFIDSDAGLCGYYSQNYEQFCLDNVLGNMNCEKCYVKVKPASNMDNMREKYGKYGVKFINGGMVPFEVLYLNMILNDNLPQLIICTESSAIWNIGCLNMVFKKKINIIEIIDIMKDYFQDMYFKEQTQNSLYLHNTCLDEDYKIVAPKTWEELYQFMEKYSFFIKPNMNEIRDKELACLKKDYMEKCSRELHFHLPRFREAYKWIMNIAQGNCVERRLIENNISRIVVYGIGDFAKMFMSSIDKTKIQIECFVITKAIKQMEYEDISILTVEEFVQNENINNLPVLISAVGSEETIKNILVQNYYQGEIFTFTDLLKN